jgi:GAF domain-containing protein
MVYPDFEPNDLIAFAETSELLSRLLHVPGNSLQGTLDAVVLHATDVVESAKYAGLILIEGGTLIPQATNGDPPRYLDQLQMQTGEGPCLEAGTTQRTILVVDLRTDGRWSGFQTRAVELGVCSMVCVPLWVSQQALGTLSLYSDRPNAFSRLHELLLQPLATHAALAIANVRHAGHLEQALLNRDLIGQAKGILIERKRITADEAFRILSSASQATSRKLVDVARDFVETGELPSER